VELYVYVTSKQVSSWYVDLSLMPLIEQVTKCMHSIKEIVWTRSGTITPVVGKL